MDVATVIINPVAGPAGHRPADRVELARAICGAHSLNPRVVLTERPGHARQLAADARRAGSPLVIAWGGDGTVNEVAAALAFGPTPLGIVPAGSGNGFARALGLPRDLAAALRTAAAGAERAIDVGQLGDRLFFNVAGIGFDALVACRANDRSRRRGIGRYVAGAFRECLRYEPLTYTIDADGASQQLRAMLIAIANGPEYGYGARIAPGATLDDGVLDCVIVEPRGIARGLWDARRLFSGAMAGAPRVRLVRFSNATITPSADCLAHVDGEPFAVTGRLDVTIHPGALRVKTSGVVRITGRTRIRSWDRERTSD